MTSQVFLDIDIDGEREAFELGAAFVDANDIKYSLSSKDVTALGGSEIARLPELFESDYEWSQKGRAIFRHSAPARRASPRSPGRRCAIGVYHSIESSRIS